MGRSATITRETRETQITITLDLDGGGRSVVATGVPFFDHMLDAFGRHGLFDLTVDAKGDLEIDAHHIIEAAFKAVARALAQAVALDPRVTGVPSTKGAL